VPGLVPAERPGDQPDQGLGDHADRQRGDELAGGDALGYQALDELELALRQVDDPVELVLADALEPAEVLVHPDVQVGEVPVEPSHQHPDARPDLVGGAGRPRGDLLQRRLVLQQRPQHHVREQLLLAPHVVVDARPLGPHLVGQVAQGHVVKALAPHHRRRGLLKLSAPPQVALARLLARVPAPAVNAAPRGLVVGVARRVHRRILRCVKKEPG
jgi:hypothetical protein